ncbi:uncharacterized protein TNCV_2092401 [Trichonephila clavipes]|nr:uncharacterized protein TNCV_2092401 [Trichonephila clavipes]
MSSFKKYKCLTISEKQKVTESVEEGERKVDVAKAFEIALNSLSTLLKNKEKIFSASSSKSEKRVSKGNFPRLEQCLVSWMRQCRGQNIPMGGSLLKEKAKAFAKELGIQFSASEGWLTNFKKRNGIVFKKMCGSSRTRFDDYVLVDTDIAVWGTLSDAEIVALDYNNTESDEDESEELTPVTLSEAKVSLNKLRDFFLQNHVDADILQASFVLEKSIDKHQLKKNDINVLFMPALGWRCVGAACGDLRARDEEKLCRTWLHGRLRQSQVRQAGQSV